MTNNEEPGISVKREIIEQIFAINRRSSLEIFNVSSQKEEKICRRLVIIEKFPFKPLKPDRPFAILDPGRLKPKIFF